jgi:hypothetical protein
MHHLPGAVNAGVRAAGAQDVNRLVRHLRERFSSFSWTLRTSF